MIPEPTNRTKVFLAEAITKLLLTQVKTTLCGSTAVKRPRRFSFYLVGFYLILSENIGKNV